MASVTGVDGKGHIKMARTAEFTFQNRIHTEILSPLFLDIEHGWMAHITIHPIKMGFVREICGGDSSHFCLKFNRSVKRHDKGLFL
jgi:hypothetical protein